MGWVRRAGILVTVLAVALGLGGAAAGAKHKKAAHAWKSKVTLTHPASNQFAGVVRSKLKACRVERVVTVTYTDPQDGGTTPLSVQRTNGKGRYRMFLPRGAFFGTYRAHVTKRKIRARKRLQKCRGAKSASLPVQ